MLFDPSSPETLTNSPETDKSSLADPSGTHSPVSCTASKLAPRYSVGPYRIPFPYSPYPLQEHAMTSLRAFLHHADAQRLRNGMGTTRREQSAGTHTASRTSCSISAPIQHCVPQLAVLESPTGTGKSQMLLNAVLSHFFVTAAGVHLSSRGDANDKQRASSAATVNPYRASHDKHTHRNYGSDEKQILRHEQPRSTTDATYGYDQNTYPAQSSQQQQQVATATACVPMSLDDALRRQRANEQASHRHVRHRSKAHRYDHTLRTSGAMSSGNRCRTSLSNEDALCIDQPCCNDARITSTGACSVTGSMSYSDEGWNGWDCVAQRACSSSCSSSSSSLHRRRDNNNSGSKDRDDDSSSSEHEDEEDEDTADVDLASRVPLRRSKIYFASRTHTQLEQLYDDLTHTDFARLRVRRRRRCSAGEESHVQIGECARAPDEEKGMHSGKNSRHTNVVSCAGSTGKNYAGPSDDTCDSDDDSESSGSFGRARWLRAVHVAGREQLCIHASLRQSCRRGGQAGTGGGGGGLNEGCLRAMRYEYSSEGRRARRAAVSSPTHMAPFSVQACMIDVEDLADACMLDSNNNSRAVNANVTCQRDSLTLSRLQTRRERSPLRSFSTTTTTPAARVSEKGCEFCQKHRLRAMLDYVLKHASHRTRRRRAKRPHPSLCSKPMGVDASGGHCSKDYANGEDVDSSSEEEGASRPETAMLSLRELHALGRRMRACPYLVTRLLLRNADVVLSPYGYLVDEDMRSTLLGGAITNSLTRSDESNKSGSKLYRAHSHYTKDNATPTYSTRSKSSGTKNSNDMLNKGCNDGKATRDHTVASSSRVRSLAPPNFAGSVVVVDEAHNVADHCRSVAVSRVTRVQLQLTAVLLQSYLQRYETRLVSRNKQRLREMVWFMQRIVQHGGREKAGAGRANSAENAEKSSEESVVAMSFDAWIFGAGVDHVDVYAFVTFLRESRLFDKLAGLVTYLLADEAAVHRAENVWTTKHKTRGKKATASKHISHASDTRHNVGVEDKAPKSDPHYDCSSLGWHDSTDNDDDADKNNGSSDPTSSYSCYLNTVEPEYRSSLGELHSRDAAGLVCLLAQLVDVPTQAHASSNPGGNSNIRRGTTEAKACVHCGQVHAVILSSAMADTQATQATVTATLQSVFRFLRWLDYSDGSTRVMLCQSNHSNGNSSSRVTDDSTSPPFQMHVGTRGSYDTNKTLHGSPVTMSSSPWIALSLVQLEPGKHTLGAVLCAADAAILAGGTMQPLALTTAPLLPSMPITVSHSNTAQLCSKMTNGSATAAAAGASAKSVDSVGTACVIQVISEGHVVPATSVRVWALGKGPSGARLEFSYNTMRRAQRTRRCVVRDRSDGSSSGGKMQAEQTPANRECIKYDGRNSSAEDDDDVNDTTLRELAMTLLNLARVLPPAGTICFFTSHDMCERVLRFLQLAGYYDKINAVKRVFCARASSAVGAGSASASAAQSAADVNAMLVEYKAWVLGQTADDDVLQQQRPEYTSHEEDDEQHNYRCHPQPQTQKQQQHRRGAMLFTVMGGRLSEGINFADDLARAVIVIGLPFANPHDIELQMYLRHVARTRRDLIAPNGSNSMSRSGDASLHKWDTYDADGELCVAGGGLQSAEEWSLYTDMCMRTVNQCIGRCIRHVDDYAAVVLLDARFVERTALRARVSNWLHPSMSVADNFGQLFRGVRAFFAERTATKA